MCIAQEVTAALLRRPSSRAVVFIIQLMSQVALKVSPKQVFRALIMFVRQHFNLNLLDGLTW